MLGWLLMGALALTSLGLVWLFFRLKLVERRIRKEAEELYLGWREREIEDVRREQSALAEREAAVRLEQWKLKSETAIRQDAVARSQSVVVGKVTEHLAPHIADFPFNPRDARFIGSPVDFVVFHGADDGLIEEVILIEIKTSTSALNARQRQIRGAVQAGRVSWREIRL